jgi:hypothetical protein
VAAAPLPDLRSGAICPALAARSVPMHVVVSNGDRFLAICCGGDTSVMLSAVRTVTAQWAQENGCATDSTVDLSGRTGWGVLAETDRHDCPTTAAR